MKSVYIVHKEGEYAKALWQQPASSVLGQSVGRLLKPSSPGDEGMRPACTQCDQHFCMISLGADHLEHECAQQTPSTAGIAGTPRASMGAVSSIAQCLTMAVQSCIALTAGLHHYEQPKMQQ